MIRVLVKMHGLDAGILTEQERGRNYEFTYLDTYSGPPVSLTLPVRNKPYTFNKFPAVFDGLLPEGSRLDYFLKLEKLDADDYLNQLIILGSDLPGAIEIYSYPAKQ